MPDILSAVENGGPAGYVTLASAAWRPQETIDAPDNSTLAT